MKKILVIILVSLYCSACHEVNGSGNIVSEDRTPGNFTGVEAGGAFEIELQNENTTRVRVEADDNLIKFIETSVDGNTLKINFKRRMSINNGHFKVYVSAPEINYINMSGAATAKIKDVLQNSDKIKLEASGASTITGKFDVPTLESDASGAATIDITGRTKKYIADGSGSANTKASMLRSETTEVTASGAASLHVFSSVSLTANASGASNIHYKGGGSTVIKTSGAASIQKED